jgi:hypothetical protein
MRLNEVLEAYNRGSGQLVNRTKSAIFFSTNCQDETRREVTQVLNIEREALEEKYLGLPTALGRSTIEAFEKLSTSVHNLVGGWCEKNLGSAGREILIKAVAQSVPTYPMSCFKLSKTTCKKMTSAISRYWWGGDEEKRKIHWRKWSEIAHTKQGGGMGFRDLHLFNLAMLGKQGWRLITRPDSLCARMLKGKYFHDGNFLTARKKRGSSHIWQAILKGREVLQTGLIKRIGNGMSTNIWSDKWIPNTPGLRPICRKPEARAEKVCELISSDGLSWNSHALRENLLPVDENAVLKIPLGKLQEDIWAWNAEKHGMYTVKSAYNLLASQARMDDMVRNNYANSSFCDSNPIWRKLWKMKIPPKIRAFWWRVINN